jgi:hypothetical protein
MEAGEGGSCPFATCVLVVPWSSTLNTFEGEWPFCDALRVDMRCCWRQFVAPESRLRQTAPLKGRKMRPPVMVGVCVTLRGLLHCVFPRKNLLTVSRPEVSHCLFPLVAASSDGSDDDVEEAAEMRRHLLLDAVKQSFHGSIRGAGQWARIIKWVLYFVLFCAADLCSVCACVGLPFVLQGVWCYLNGGRGDRGWVPWNHGRLVVIPVLRRPPTKAKKHVLLEVCTPQVCTWHLTLL